MHNFNRKTLVVVGAGPKGLAVAVKAKVLEEFGFAVSKVILIEKNGVAANWSGNFGYTNGEMKLGTPPEKDVVFPLDTDVGEASINERIRQRLMHFTWNSFLVQTQRFSDWVDRGRPAPCHQMWSMYLNWISQQLEPQASILKGEVVKIDLSESGDRWELVVSGFSTRIIHADGLMLTGPGKTRLDFMANINEELPRGVYDLESFWRALKSKEFNDRGNLAIVGAGENAASILLALSQYAPQMRVDVITPRGFISTRAESFYENQIYSQPERNGWKEMDIADRKDFMGRTDLGVFSTHAMEILNDQIHHRVVPGRLIGLNRFEDSLLLRLDYHNQISTQKYDQIVLATGFDQVSMLRTILSPRALKNLEDTTGKPLNQRHIASLIQKDLSVRGMYPTLHLPMLAGLMQGPGFANLSCLGRLSDRILGSTNEAEIRFDLAEAIV
jgi:mycobactin lysine-N-oxygenase